MEALSYISLIENVRISTPYAPSIVAQFLQDATDHLYIGTGLVDQLRIKGKYIVAAKDKPKPFVGEVSDQSFRIIRRLEYRNSFFPIVEGTISALGSGSEVNIRLSPVRFIRLWSYLGNITMLATFSALWLSWVYSIGTFYVRPEYALLTVLGFWLYGVLFMALAFKFETRKVKQALLRVLRVQEGV